MAKQTRKAFPLRISADLYEDLRKWSEQEMRSVNAQIEFILRQAVNKRRTPKNPSSNPTSTNEGEFEED